MNPETVKSPGARKHSGRMAAILLALLAHLPAAQARDHKAQTPGAIKVIANMSFEGGPATGMQITQAKGKSYLYVQLANAQRMVVVEISKPNKLKIVSSMPSPDPAVASQLSINGNAAMMTAVSKGSQAATKRELVLWDISQPGNPRVVQRFSGVVRILQDGRNYTYVLNQNGLWVISDKQDTTTDDSWNPSIYG